MKNTKKLLIILALALSLMTACSKKPAEKTEEGKAPVEDAETTENTEEEKEEEPVEEAKPTIEADELKFAMRDSTYKLYSFDDGNKYIRLDEFSEFLAPSIHRFSIKANDKNKRIAMKEGEFNHNKKSVSSLDLSQVQFDEYELRLDKQSMNYKVGFLKGFYFLEVNDAMEFFDFKLEGDGKDEVVFAVPDKKQMEAANNRDYDWYEDQAHTGEYNEGNCGPTSMGMVLKWLDPNSTANGESCRNEVPNDGQWWSTNIVEDYFKAHDIHYDDVFYKYPELITDEIDKGNIVYVCAIMREIKENTKPESNKFGRFYGFDGGHFFLIKGYKVINGELYFEVYDPNGWDKYYPDTNEPMGKDRLYAAREVDLAIKNWYMTVFSIYPAGK